MGGRTDAEALGRNDPCHCGSGRKYKQCHAEADRQDAAAAEGARALLRRGKALEQRGDVEAALAVYRQAAGTAGAAAEAHSRMGHLLLSLGRGPEAVIALRAAAAGGGVAGQLDLVRALVLEKKDAQAEAAVRTVLDAEPDSADGHWLLGRLLAESGRFDDARKALARTVALAPKNAAAFYDLVRCYDLTEADRPLVGRMVSLAREGARAGLDTDGRARLHLAIGKAFDDLADPEQAMQHFDEAAALKATLARFDRDAFDAQVEGLIARFTPAFIAAGADAGNASERPVMVLGLPRSGTTLVEQILSSHRDVAGAGELQFWPANGPVFSRLDEAQAPGFVGKAATAYLEILEGLAPGAARVVDKSPPNFLWAGLIHLAFPGARIIHCRRDPLDTCLSIHATYFAPRADFPAEAHELVAYVEAYRRVVAHWRRVLPADRFIEVDYETLVSRPEAETRRLVASLGLDWDPACLRPQDNARVVRTPSKRQARQPVNAASVGRWRRYEPWLGPLAALRPGVDSPVD